MPLIFIHGVRQRSETALENLKFAFRDVLNGLTERFPELAEPNFAVEAPFWGRHGVEPRYEQKILPFGKAGSSQPRLRGGSAHEKLLPDEALDLLREVTADDEEVIKSLIRKAAADSANPNELREVDAWLSQASLVDTERSASLFSDEDDLTYRSLIEPRSPIRPRNIAQSVLDALERAATTYLLEQPGALAWIESGHTDMSQFLGDALKYVAQRESKREKAPILAEITAHLPREHNPKDPLIVLTHSMGGLIFYDILTKFRPKLKVDCWISIGSQVSQFASLGMLANDANLEYDANEKIVGLAGRVGRWVNVYGRLDFLNYRAADVFADVTDCEYTSVRGPSGSHSWCFREPEFYQLLGELISDALASARVRSDSHRES